MTEHKIDQFWMRCFESLARPGASELVANGPGNFFVTHNGVKEPIQTPEMSLRYYEESIEASLVPLVESEVPFDPKGYIFEGRYSVPSSSLLQGFEGRCHITLSPISDVPQVTLTKITATTSTVESIAESGSMSTEMMNFLIMAAKAKLTIVLSGQSGAGKTTTLQALTKHFDEQDHIGIAEDIPELKLTQKNVAYLHTLPPRPGLDDKFVADLSFLVKQWLRMRIDRGIVGETRGKEFADFLVAANAGMAGSLTTIHANDPSGALDKMTRFALIGSDRQPIRSINKEIGTAVDLVVQLARINGKHRVTHIEEITKVVGEAENAPLSSAALYEYNPVEDNWKKANQMTEELKKKLILRGVDLKPFTAQPVGTVMGKHNARAQNPNHNRGGEFGGGNPFGRAI